MECICSSCKNLKSIIDEKDVTGNSIVEVCEFGFVSEDCIACELEGCELTCEHYEMVKAEEQYVIKHCARCHKELKLVAGKAEEGEHFCVACYLSKP